MPTPDPGQVARQIVGAMVAGEPVEPIGWATAKDQNDKPVYMIAVIMGSHNIEQFEKSLEKIKTHMSGTDTFDGTPGQPTTTALDVDSNN